MTPEYVALSLRAGWLAATIDEALSGKGMIGRAGVQVRKMRWRLTDTYLEELKSEAIRQGVPPDLLEKSEGACRELLARDE
jgi:ABC-type antimicrobial peptide transport system ATPase subunit